MVSGYPLAAGCQTCAGAILVAMPGRRTQEAVGEVAQLDAAKAAAGTPVPGAGAGSQDPLVGELRKAGLLRLLVLHALERAPSYGNQLIEFASDATAGLLAVNPNTMYPLLRALEQEGLVRGEWEHPERRSRRFYALTDAGRAERARLASRVAPRLDAVAAAVTALRRELDV
jgi:PadR family transcriptional regulator PadR